VHLSTSGESQADKPPECDLKEAVEVTPEPKTHILLQETSYVRIKAYSCIAVNTRLGEKCESYTQSQGIVPQFTSFEQPWTIGADKCRKAWETGSYHLYGKNYRVTPNAITNFVAHETGRILIQKQNAYCDGGYATWPDGSKTALMVIHNYIKLTMREETLLIDDEHNIIWNDKQVQTKCQQHQGQCELKGQGTTLVWTPQPPTKICHLYKARVTKGHDVSSANKTIFISTDGTMVRVEKKSHESKCGHSVWSTNYQKLFLTDDLLVPEFQRELHPAETSLTTYANQQDNFLAASVLTEMKNEFDRVNRHHCANQHEAYEYDYIRRAARNGAALAGQTIALSRPGHFATANGETWYQYQCRPLTVYAIDLPACYSALPVQLKMDDAQRFVRTARLQTAKDKRDGKKPPELHPETYPQFFVEPYTHRLTTVSTEIACTMIASPAYQNAQGSWIAATPAIAEINDPLPLKEPTEASKDYELPDYVDQAENGGIYTPEGIRAFEDLTQTPRLRTEIPFEMIRHDPRAHHQGQLKVNYLFPKEEIMTFDPASFGKKIWDNFVAVGSICSILVLLVLTGRMVTCGLGLYIRARKRSNETGDSLISQLPKVLLPSLAMPIVPRLRHRLVALERQERLREDYIKRCVQEALHAEPAYVNPGPLLPPQPPPLYSTVNRDLDDLRQQMAELNAMLQPSAPEPESEDAGDTLLRAIANPRPRKSRYDSSPRD
jgi:hypothetical protein